MEDNMSIIINFLMSGSVAILGVIAGYYIANKKYIFEKTYDQKSICIIDLYKEVVRLEFQIRRYVNQGQREELNEIKTAFQKFQHKFWEIEIILDESSIEKINKFRNKHLEITSKLSASNYNESLCLDTSDLVKVKNELKKEFRKTLKIKS